MHSVMGAGTIVEIDTDRAAYVVQFDLCRRRGASV